ncbi:hypothetical protein ANN_28070 [Periplaneta americana]|uniref:Uncharacterized protein n=1 Tax=Periplaneta americana TaxID=6978 RepID=A0ABQ8RUQ0_PERAM|nr:hypothetical protein ANN_28070 [Periplaneta americana]
MDLREVGYDDRDWIYLAQDRDRWRAYNEGESEDEIGGKINGRSGSELVQHDVSVAYRIPSRPGKTRPIVIRFTKSRSSDEWLQLFRNEAKNDGSGPGNATKKVNRDLSSGRITAGDQLTAVTRDLLNKTRVARKDEASPTKLALACAKNGAYQTIYTRPAQTALIERGLCFEERESRLTARRKDDNADNDKSDHQSEASEVSNHHLEPQYDPETPDEEDLSINEKSSYHQCDPQEGKEKKNRMVRDQVSTEGVAKQRPVTLQVPLGQGWSDVQGRCRVATVNSSYAKAQDAYDELNCLNGQESLCR